MEECPDKFPEWVRQTAETEIIDCASRNWQSKIFAALKPPFGKDPTGYRGDAPLLRILEIVKELGARTAVVEPYISTDWNEEFGAMYSRVFHPPPQRASRIHFFSGEASEPPLKAKDFFVISKERKATYIGYTVIRPLPAFRVGDTVLKSPCYILHSGEIGMQRVYLSHCGAEFTTSLLGNKLSVKGMPFMQQETNVGVCAEADLWMLARYLNKMSETVRYRPAEITEIANRTLTLGPPRDGLTDSQIFGAFRTMGLKAQPYSPGSAAAARDFLYTCVESSIPVIVSLPGHVVVVIGHDYMKKMKFRSSARSMSALVQNFYVHDDAAGPYLPLKVSTKMVRNVEMLTLGGELVEMCLVPLPARVNLTLGDVLRFIDPWIAYITEYVAAEMPKIPKKQLWRAWPKGGLIRRIYLRRSSEFKQDLLRGSGNKRNLDIIAHYRCMQMPKYIWVVELAERKELQGQNPYSRRIRGEIIFDATGNRHAMESCLLSFHYEGRLYIKGYGEHSSQFLWTPDASPYQPLLRAARPPERE